MVEDTPLDPAASAALIAEQRAKVEAAVEVDGRILFVAWGVAWLLGFGLLWAVDVDPPLVDIPRGMGLTVFFALLVAAMAVTAVHLARKARGVRGTSALQGAMYGWSWFLAFAGVGALGYALHRDGASEQVSGMVMMTVSTLVVGSLYMADGAIWGERAQFTLGAWILVATIIAVVAGAPNMLLVMSLAGGGGMLAAAGVEATRRGRPRVL